MSLAQVLKFGGQIASTLLGPPQSGENNCFELVV